MAEVGRSTRQRLAKADVGNQQQQQQQQQPASAQSKIVFVAIDWSQRADVRADWTKWFGYRNVYDFCKNQVDWEVLQKRTLPASTGCIIMTSEAQEASYFYTIKNTYGFVVYRYLAPIQTFIIDDICALPGNGAALLQYAIMYAYNQYKASYVGLMALPHVINYYRRPLTMGTSDTVASFRHIRVPGIVFDDVGTPIADPSSSTIDMKLNDTVPCIPSERWYESPDITRAAKALSAYKFTSPEEAFQAADFVRFLKLLSTNGFGGVPWKAKREYSWESHGQYGYWMALRLPHAC